MSHCEDIEHAGCKIALHYDEDPESPRQNSNPGVMYAYYRGYELGDEQLPEGGFEQIDCPVCKGGDMEAVCPRCEDFGYVDPTVLEWLQSLEAIAAAPLFVYEHGGITMSVGELKLIEQPITRGDTRSAGRFVGDGAGWDTSFVGFIVYTEASITPCCGDGAEYRTQEWLQECAEGEVEEYASYLEGDVYGYIVYDPEDNEQESCWGFIGHKHAVEAAKEAAETVASSHERELAERAEWAARDVMTLAS